MDLINTYRTFGEFLRDVARDDDEDEDDEDDDGNVEAEEDEDDADYYYRNRNGEDGDEDAVYNHRGLNVDRARRTYLDPDGVHWLNHYQHDESYEESPEYGMREDDDEDMDENGMPRGFINANGDYIDDGNWDIQYNENNVDGEEDDENGDGNNDGIYRANNDDNDDDEGDGYDESPSPGLLSLSAPTNPTSTGARSALHAIIDAVIENHLQRHYRNPVTSSSSPEFNSGPTFASSSTNTPRFRNYDNDDETNGEEPSGMPEQGHEVHERSPSESPFRHTLRFSEFVAARRRASMGRRRHSSSGSGFGYGYRGDSDDVDPNNPSDEDGINEGYTGTSGLDPNGDALVESSDERLARSAELVVVPPMSPNNGYEADTEQENENTPPPLPPRNPFVAWDDDDYEVDITHRENINDEDSGNESPNTGDMVTSVLVSEDGYENVLEAIRARNALAEEHNSGEIEADIHEEINEEIARGVEADLNQVDQTSDLAINVYGENGDGDVGITIPLFPIRLSCPDLHLPGSVFETSVAESDGAGVVGIDVGCGNDNDSCVYFSRTNTVNGIGR